MAAPANPACFELSSAGNERAGLAPPTSGRRARTLIVAGMPLLFALARYAPIDRLPITVCGFRLVTGVPCPGCGMTRAVCLSARGDWLGAIQYHPAVFIVLAIGVWIWFQGLASLLPRFRLPIRNFRTRSTERMRSPRLHGFAAGLLTLIWAWNLFQFARGGEALARIRGSVLGRVLTALGP